MALLDGKKIIITGGSMGIGFAVAKECATEGADLILISRHKKDLEKALIAIGNNENKHSFYSLDVGEPDRVEELAGIVEKNIGVIDGLVNCAGIYGPIGKSYQINPAEFTNAVKINLLGTFYMFRYFIPLLMKAKKGKIVNYSGGGASGPFPNYTAYATSKTAVVKLTENIAVELKNNGVDVNVVAPGFVATRLHQKTIKAGTKAGEDFLKKTAEQIEKGGVSPKIAAELTVFLLSPASDGITGKFISAPWDPWKDENFIAKLKSDKNLATLRRIDDKSFCGKD